MKVIAQKAEGSRPIVAPKPRSKVTPEQLAKAFGGCAAVTMGEGRNPLHAWQEARSLINSRLQGGQR